MSWIDEVFELFVGRPQLEQKGDCLPDPVHVPKVKLGVIVGHEKKAPGAVMVSPFSQSEYKYNSEVARIMEEEIKSYSMPIDMVVIFRDGVGIKGAYKKAANEKCDCVIELHFNAYNGAVKGTETLCTSDHRDQEFAGVVQKLVCSLFHRDGLSRGVKVMSRADRGGVNVHSFPSGANCLVEPFFGDNYTDAEAATTKQRAYAKYLLDAVVLWARKNDMLGNQ